MAKKPISREEVNTLLISNKYMTKGNGWLTLRQTAAALFGWALVILPFIWLALPLRLHRLGIVYREEIVALKFLVLFLSCAFLFLLVLLIGLTIWNNRRFSRLLNKEVIHDEALVERRRAALAAFYAERFGDQEFRQNVRYYSVAPEKNIATDEVKKLYKANGVSL